MRGLIGALVVAALAPAAASAQNGEIPINGRNFAGAQVKLSGEGRQINMISLRGTDGGDTVNVWLRTAPPGCGGADAVGTRNVPVDDEGRFSAKLLFGPIGDRVGSARVEGQFFSDEAGQFPLSNGTIALIQVRARTHFEDDEVCHTGTLNITAIDPKRGVPGAGMPGPDALFVGHTEQLSDRIFVRMPIVGVVSRDGTQMKRLISSTNLTCDTGRDPGGIFLVSRSPIMNGGFTGVAVSQFPVGSGQTRTTAVNADGTFRNRSLVGDWRVRETTRQNGTQTEACDSSVLDYVAARVR